MLAPEKLKECNICYDKKEDFIPCKQCKINVCLDCFKKLIRMYRGYSCPQCKCYYYDIHFDKYFEYVIKQCIENCYGEHYDTFFNDFIKWCRVIEEHISEKSNFETLNREDEDELNQEVNNNHP